MFHSWKVVQNHKWYFRSSMGGSVSVKLSDLELHITAPDQNFPRNPVCGFSFSHFLLMHYCNILYTPCRFKILSYPQLPGVNPASPVTFIAKLLTVKLWFVGASIDPLAHAFVGQEFRSWLAMVQVTLAPPRIDP